MTNEEYLRARKIIETERQTKLDALDMTWTLFNKGKLPPKPIEGHADAVNAVRGWRQLADQAIAKTPNRRDFTIRDVQGFIEAAGIDVDQSALSTYLKKLADDGELDVVEAGRGRRATVFAKK